eukprot:s828_g12.t3
MDAICTWPEMTEGYCKRYLPTRRRNGNVIRYNIDLQQLSLRKDSARRQAEAGATVAKCSLLLSCHHGHIPCLIAAATCALFRVLPRASRSLLQAMATIGKAFARLFSGGGTGGLSSGVGLLRAEFNLVCQVEVTIDVKGGDIQAADCSLLAWEAHILPPPLDILVSFAQRIGPAALLHPEVGGAARSPRGGSHHRCEGRRHPGCHHGLRQSVAGG